MADNLLDKASILLTPTAYNDGRMLSVKPNENVYSSELITNGDFSNGTTGWTFANGTVTDKYIASLTAYQSGLKITPFIKTGKYKVVFDLVITSGSCKFDAGSGNDKIYATSGTKEILITNPTKFEFNAFNLGFVGSIDNVSIVEDLSGDFTFSRGSAATRVNAQGLVENVQIISDELVSNGNFSQEGSELVTNGDFATNSNWSLGNWTIENNTVTIDGQSGILSQATPPLVAGKKYKWTFEITEYISGSVKLYSGGGGDAATYENSVGTHTQYFVANGTGKYFYSNSFNGSIDNVSVKEVGQDWTFGTGWSLDQANSKVVGDGTSFTYITQSPISIQNKKVKLTFDISDYVSGTFRLLPSDRQDGLDERFSGNGSYEVVYISTLDTFRFQQQAFNGSISNVSVKEITDDTDLPRIDYTDGCGSWLLEGQSTNMVRYSEDFSNAEWGQVGSPTLTSGQLAPDGTLSATKISGTIGSSNIAMGTSSSTTATRTIWARTVSGTGTAKLMSYYQNTNNLFTLTEEWQRFELTGSTAIGAVSFYIDFRDFTQTLSEFIIWGAQSEELPYATSYIPTNGAIATRLADVATSSGNSILINSTEGVLVFKPKYLVDNGASRKISISDGSNSNRLYITPYQGLTSRLRYIFTTGGVTQADLQITGLNLTSENIFAVVWDNNRFEFWCNGVKISEDTNGTTPSQGTFNILTLGSELNNNTELYQGFLDFIAVYKEALTDAQLQSLTTI